MSLFTDKLSNLSKLFSVLIAGFFLSILTMDRACALYIMLEEDAVQPGVPRTAVLRVKFGNENTFGPITDITYITKNTPLPFTTNSSIPRIMGDINIILNRYPVNPPANAPNPKIRMIEFHNVETLPSRRRARGLLIHLNEHHNRNNGELLLMNAAGNVTTEINVLHTQDNNIQQNLINLLNDLH